MKTFYISTAIPYVNSAPHLGHALEFTQADVLARLARARGKDVFFLSGTDDNAQKNVEAAKAAKIDTRAFVDKHATVFKQLLSDLSISNNDFIRTSTDERHIRGAQKLWDVCKKEDIYKKKYRGLYCSGCEEFKREQDLVSGECSEHPGKKLEAVEEENYFFKLSNYQKQIEDLLVSDKLRIIPVSRKNELLSFVREGLQDFSISRSRERVKDWGISVPGDDSQVMYVWFDALSNYINALGYADNTEVFQKYWQKGDEIAHVIGKGITRFHAIYWPAMLISAGVALPKTIFVHGYLTLAGAKISKTLGNVVDPFELIKKYGTDAVRYYLLREIASSEDGDYSEEKFIGRYNADLANGLGNLVSRVFTLAEKRGELANDIGADIEKEVTDKISASRDAVQKHIADLKFNEALASLWELVSFGDKFVNDRKPWAEADNRQTLVNALTIIDNIAALLAPFLPQTTEKITKSITWTGDKVRVSKIAPLFPRI